MRVTPVAGIAGPLVVEPVVRTDDRGWFRESSKASILLPHGIGPFVQENESRSRKGVIRGLHLQVEPNPQGKLVRCTQGEVFDVAVDLRPGSPTRLRHVAIHLDADLGRQLWIPPGFAHGFQALSDGATLAYLLTHEYDPAAERTVRWDDPELAIPWPLPAGPMNDRDRNAPRLAEARL